jgi:hypothetical protein
MLTTLTQTAPTSQKVGDRPISFVLDDRTTGSMESISLIIRPEDLTRSEPSRMAVHQTLGTGADVAWVDNFGPGLPTINISGHTGWRDHNTGDGDGIERFEALYNLAFVDWHSKRKSAVSSGLDPDLVQLIFADALDGFSYVVAPQNFTLRRSRSRPLLMMYQMSLLVVNTSVDSEALGSGGVLSSLTQPQSALSSLGLESLEDALSTISSFADDIASLIDGTLGVASAKFLALTETVLNAVMEAVGTYKDSIDSISSSLLSVAKNLSRAAWNIFTAINAVSSLGAFTQQRIAQVASAFSTAFCLLSNVFKTSKTYKDYSDMYGASRCSSTAGGSALSPLRYDNPFSLMFDTDSTVSVSTSAASAISSAITMDPVLSPSSSSSLATLMTSIATGVTVPDSMVTA